MARFCHGPSGSIARGNSHHRPVGRAKGAAVANWWYCLKHQRVEPDQGCPNSERLGPFDTEEQAGQALEVARLRNEEWERGEDEWGDRPKDEF